MINLNKLIVIEGCGDGVGKSTQFLLLRDQLIKDGYVVQTHHFPSYGEYHAKGVEEYLQGNLGELKDLSPYFINNVYAHDRAVAWYKYLKKSYDNGDTILLDRYVTSSLIYQTANMTCESDKKSFIDYIMDYEYSKLGLKEPDQVLFLHAPHKLLDELLRKRIHNDGVFNDIHERQKDYLERVYETSMFIADYLHWEKIDCSTDGKLRSIHDIHKDVYSKVMKK